MSYLKNYRATDGIFDGIKDFFTPSSPDSLVKQLQRESNRYVGTAIPTRIAEDGKIGASTVAAVRAIASFLISQGAVQSDSFVQSGPSTTADFINKHVSEYISIFDKEANRRGLVAPKAPSSGPAETISLPTSFEPQEAGLMAQLTSPLGIVLGVGVVYLLANRKKGRSRKKGRR